MSWTSAEENRIQTAEEMLNTLQTAVGNLVAKQQWRQAVLLLQATIDALALRVSSLETQVTNLQADQD